MAALDESLQVTHLPVLELSTFTLGACVNMPNAISFKNKRLKTARVEILDLTRPNLRSLGDEPPGFALFLSFSEMRLLQTQSSPPLES